MSIFSWLRICHHLFHVKPWIESYHALMASCYIYLILVGSARASTTQVPEVVQRENHVESQAVQMEVEIHDQDRLVWSRDVKLTPKEDISCPTRYQSNDFMLETQRISLRLYKA